MTFYITVTVKGPGGCIATEMAIIRKTLQNFGIHVNTVDDHVSKMTDEDLIRQLEERNKRGVKPFVVNLVAEHLPWGG